MKKGILRKILPLCLLGLMVAAIIPLASCKGGGEEVEVDPDAEVISDGLSACIKYITQNNTYKTNYSGSYVYNKTRGKIIYKLYYDVTYNGTEIAGYSTQYFLYNTSTLKLIITDSLGYTQYVNEIQTEDYDGKTGTL